MNFRIRMYAALTVAFAIAFFLNKELFFLNTPVIRKDPFIDVAQLPKKLAQYIPARSDSSSGSPNTPAATSAPKPTVGPYITPEKTNPGAPTSPKSLPPTTEPTETAPSPTGSGWISITPSQQPPVDTTTPPTPTSKPVSKVEFAQCLKDNGMVFYSTATCTACQQQKNLFGTEAFSKLNVVNCDSNALECRNKGIGRGPAWITSTGKVYPGAMDLTSLHFASGCPQVTNGFSFDAVINQILSLF